MRAVKYPTARDKHRCLGVENERDYCYVKVHFSGKDVVVAACDRELIGKTIEGKGIRLVVKEEFYKGELIPLGELNDYIARGTIINLLGNKVVREAAKKAPILLDTAIEIGGVLHVQWVRRL